MLMYKRNHVFETLLCISSAIIPKLHAIICVECLCNCHSCPYHMAKFNNNENRFCIT